MRSLSTSGPISAAVGSGWRGTLRALAAALVVCAPLTGCGGGSDADLRSYVAEVKMRPGGPIEELPPIAPYVGYTYPCDGAVACPDPFEPFFLEPPDPCKNPSSPECGQNTVTEGPKPDFDRNREELESYPLDGLRMMGTLEKGDQFWAILRSPDSIIHRVQVGNYIGQNHGKITEITEDKIQLLEIVPNGRGGWEERDAELALVE
jgi:type IV pilus assembly protein PilP